jgi:hypothetical protein
MILLYPDETEVREKISWQKNIVKFIFDIPEIMDYEPSTLPCCNPENFKTISLNQTVDPKNLLQKIKQIF